MGETEEQSISLVEGAKEGNQLSNNQTSDPTQLTMQSKSKKWWALMIIYTLLVLLGQSFATLLSRLYYTQGGKTILLEALLETIGFPILIPFALYYFPKYPLGPTKDQPSFSITIPIYVTLGLLQASSNILYAIGLKNLPLSIFSLISTTQVGFNVLFSFFLNAQKITLLIVISLILVTISSTLLIINGNSSENTERKRLILGFSCTLIASTLYSLVLSLTELSFNKIVKSDTFSAVLNMIIYQSLVESLVLMVALFFTGEWHNLAKEMENFEQGTASYVVILVVIAISWQLCSIGAVGLILAVSSLFSNVISTVGLPLMPILAAIFFHEKMDGVKLVSVLLAAGGFGCYMYQHYLDDKFGKDNEIVEVGVSSSIV